MPEATSALFARHRVAIAGWEDSNLQPNDYQLYFAVRSETYLGFLVPGVVVTLVGVHSRPAAMAICMRVQNALLPGSSCVREQLGD
jgi:hypothetical protein